MIKLTVNPNSQQPPHCFDKAAVIIGSGPVSQADLAIPGEKLEPVHVKIMEQEGRFVVINQANDPFATLNGIPFAKRTIKNGDILQIGETVILFESSLSKAPVRELWVQSEEELHGILEKALTSKSAQHHSHTSSYQPLQGGNSRSTNDASNAASNDELSPEEIDIERELERLAELELQDEGDPDPDVEALLHRLEGSEQMDSAHNEPVQPRITSPEPSPNLKQREMRTPPVSRPSLKDFYLSDIDEDLEGKEADGKGKGDKKRWSSSAFSYEGMSWNWKLIASFLSALLLLGMLLALFFYFSMKAKNRDEELKVAEGLADISMALTYAQFNHIQPRNQNWTDPEFLKNNLISVLASEYSPITSLDMHGLFNNTNYILRIYNSSDLSHYVIIAQPAPSLSQWVLPRAALVVDSKAMELRKMKDLKSLNRLMLNSNPLDGAGTSEVSLLIKQGELMPLARLASKSHKQGFNPPKALALLRPGAENLIYNAPRYYRFGEQFLKKAMAVAAVGNSDEINLLQEEIATLSHYPDIVLYASQGMQWTVRAQKMLSSLMPNNKILLAYLKLNTSGYVASSHLLMDEGRPSIALGEEPVPHEPVERADLFTQPPLSAGVSSVEPIQKEAEFVQTETKLETISAEDSLLQELRQLSLARGKALRDVENELLVLLMDQDREEALALLSRMEQILNKHRDQYLDQPEKLRKQMAAVQFLSKLQLLVAGYDALMRDQRDELVNTLTRIYQEHSDISYERFMDYVTEAGL